MFDKHKIAKFQIFQGLSPEEINHISLLGQEVEYENEEIIFEDSRLPSDFFILLDGRASVEMDVPHMDKDGRKRVQLAILRGGDVFGEIGLLEGKRRSASVKAIEKVLALKINGKKLTKFLRGNPHAGYQLMRNLALILSQRITDVIFMLRNDIRRIL